MEKVIRIYQCEDSVDGILSAVYEAGISHYGHKYIRLQALQPEAAYNYSLFSEYINIETDMEKSRKVAESIREKISERAYQMVVRAALSCEEDKANYIYHFLVLGFHMGKKVVDCIQDENVYQIFAMNRNVGNESHYYREFLRFEEISGGILLAKIEPKNAVVSLVAPHFADRLDPENFIILDVGRGEAAFHSAGQAWYLKKLSEEEKEKLLQYSEEDIYQNLWRSFFQKIGIEERKNGNLQRNNMPLHYRKYATEFIQKQDKIQS